MRSLRVGVRLAAMAVATLVLVVPAAVSLSLGDRSIGFRSRITRAWSRAMTAIMGVDVRVEGTPPAAPFYLVSNHLGYLDIPVLCSVLPAVFVAKSEVARWPIIGALCRLVDTVFVDRGRKRDLPRVVAHLQALLAGGVGVVAFPEGTSSEGARVLPFRPSLLDPAVRRGYGVSCASVTYATPAGGPPARLAVCWWGDMTFGRHFLDLLGIRRVTATIRFGSEPVTDDDRRRLAERLHAEVSRLFTPVDTDPARPSSETAWTPSAT